MIKLIRIKAAAKAIGVSVQTIYRWSDTDPTFPPLIKLSPGATAIEEQLFDEFVRSKAMPKGEAASHADA